MRPVRIARLGLPIALAGLFGAAPAAHAQLTFSGPTSFPAGTNPDRLVVADFNGDNDLDAAVTTGDIQGLSILVGGPGATFGQPTTYDVGSNPQDIAVGD